jgi:hypothetical protein
MRHSTLKTNDRVGQSAHKLLRIEQRISTCEYPVVRFGPSLWAQETRTAVPKRLDNGEAAHESFSVALGQFRPEMFVSFGVQQSTPCSTSGVIARIYLPPSPARVAKF